MPSEMRFAIVGSEFERKNRATTATAMTRTSIPIAVSRTDETRSTRRTWPMRANWISARGKSRSTMKSMIVGNASGTLVQRSENRRNEPIHCVASARISAPR